MNLPTSPPAEPSPRRDRVVDAAVVTLGMAVLAGRAASLPVGGGGLGVDWYNYLQNAWAMGNGHWEDYVRWRGPAHAWLSLEAAQVFGGLIVGSQWVAAVCMVALVPLTWALGRLAFDKRTAWLGALLIAAWPDFALFARFSTPYPLFGMAVALGMAGLAGALTATRSRGAAIGTVTATLAMGLAIATDQRAIPYTVALGVAVLAAPPLGGAAPSWRRAVTVALPVVAGGLTLGWLANGQLPFELVPLSEQVALQRDLHATEGGLACTTAGMTMPGLADLVGECARQTVSRNLLRAAACVGVGLPLLAGLTGLGAVRALRDTRTRWRAALLLPALTLIPSLLLVDVPHRYLLPFAPLFALLLVDGFAWFAGALSRRLTRGETAGWAMVATFVALVLVAQYRNEGAPMGRAWTGRVPRGIAPPAVLGQARPMDTMGEQLRRDVRPGDTVVDCARGGLHLRLYPFDVEQVRPPRPTVVAGRCRALMTDGPDKAGTTWLLSGIPADAPVNPVWQQAFLIPRPMEKIALLRATKE